MESPHLEVNFVFCSDPLQVQRSLQSLGETPTRGVWGCACVHKCCNRILGVSLSVSSVDCADLRPVLQRVLYADDPGASPAHLTRVNNQFNSRDRARFTCSWLRDWSRGLQNWFWRGFFSWNSSNMSPFPLADALLSSSPSTSQRGTWEHPATSPNPGSSRDFEFLLAFVFIAKR